jgi:hypothetical protein
MVSECYLSADDVRRLREVRRRMADAAAKGDLEETRLWTGRLAAFARSREGDFAAYSLRWHKLRERAASLTVRAECLSAQERQDAQDELDSAFASRDERKANAALAELEMMIGREVESSALVLDAAALCALARKRMAAEECTCCWASPEERRKAAAWLAVLESCAGEGRLDLLAVGVPLFREFVRLHDEGHGEVVEASRREIAGRLRQVLSEDADDTHPLNADQMYCTRSAFGARLLLHTHDV